MNRLVSGTILILSLGVGCGELLSPSPEADIYLLNRIGETRLPAPVSPGASDVLYADTLAIVSSRTRRAEPIIRRTRVVRDGEGRLTSSLSHFAFRRRDDLLIINSCPLRSICLAIVLPGLTLRVVGDSLFEQVPPESPRPPLVFGRIPTR